MKVEVYGGHHSPWVQAVLLGLHEKGIEYSLRPLPPLETLRRWGLVMPAVSIDGGPWIIESAEILAQLGFEPIGEQDLQAVQGAWQGVLHRPDNALRFFAGFARAGDRSSSLFKRTLRNFLRSFVTFHMFTLIKFVKLKHKPKDPEDFGAQFMYWETALAQSDGPFLGGNAPKIQDIMMFGMVQCHSSIPVPPLEPLRGDERLHGLRQWVGLMHERFDDYPYLFSGSYFEPNLPPTLSASFPQRVIFYIGLVFMFLAFPITLPLDLILINKVPR